jgi:alpha-glucosidase
VPVGPPRNLVYQIFVDRFAGSDGRGLADPPPNVNPWHHHCGGTLDGVTARLDHVVSLGADAIYLTPVFRAPSNHKYDTESYDEIDPGFGGDAAFDRLAAACRERGLGLILDGVFNHVGEGHTWFREARADATSARAAFFRFARHPDQFAIWRGYGWLPELDLGRAEVMAEICEQESSVVRRWLRRGATGWRIDCANDLGLGVCARVAAAARSEGAVDGIIGEVMTYAADWVTDGRLDGVMNYYFRETAIGLCTGAVPVVQAAYNLKRVARAYRPDALLRSWNILSSHDTPRLATTILDSDACRLARTLAFVCPGVPLVYYGDEVGLPGGADPDNRRPMPWNERSWDRATLSHIRQLAELRRKYDALRLGDYLPLPQPGAPGLLAFARTTKRPQDLVIVLANASAEPVRARVFVPYAFLFDALPLVDLLGVAATARVSAGAFDVALKPWQVALYHPDDTTIGGYSFFRDR